MKSLLALQVVKTESHSDPTPQTLTQGPTTNFKPEKIQLITAN